MYLNIRLPHLLMTLAAILFLIGCVARKSSQISTEMQRDDYNALDSNPINNFDFKLTSSTESDLSPETQKDLITLLSSKNPEIATKALEAIFTFGEPLIQELIKCQGNRSIYWGYKLGHPDSADVVFFPKKQGLEQTHVTVEIAALYLLEAIYRDDLQFALNPYLLDITQKDFEQGYNSDELINRAWASVNQWEYLFKQGGLDSLREKRINPLYLGDINFIGAKPLSKDAVGDGPSQSINK